MSTSTLSNTGGELFASSSASSEPSKDSSLISNTDAMSRTAISTSGADGQLPRLQPHYDARALIRLLQCPICSLPLRTPVTLPCGNSCCRPCLPPSHLRKHITFSAAGRQQGVDCPFPSCGLEHPLEECPTDVVLYKIADAVATQAAIARSKRDQDANGMRNIILEEVVETEDLPPRSLDPPVDSEKGESELVDLSNPVEEKAHTHSSKGGRLLATLDFALTGQLRYASNVHFEADEAKIQNEAAEIGADEEFLQCLKDATSKDVECNVCYHLMLEPTTTPCGHTFCRKCLARVLDYSSLCPECRRELYLPSSLARQPHNQFLVHIMSSLYPEEIAARAAALQVEESSTPEGLDTALFPCTVAFPGLKTFLHIFEPRYRLMIRRAIAGNGTFGIMSYNRFLEPQGQLGRTQFMAVGTMLKIEQYSLLEDGRSIIECQGLYRFRVRDHGMLDGYIVANVEKINDISLAEEEALEANETTLSPVPETDVAGQIERMSTTQLCEKIASFISSARSSSSRWVHQRLLETYGEPPELPALLPYWLAAVLPLVDEEKYRILPTTSVRERLKITARWIQRIENQRW